jgi:hypothetical protein
LKNERLFRRVESLSEKLEDKDSASMLRIDFDSFSEAEKALFRKVDEIEEKFHQTGSLEPEAENFALVYKNLEVIWRRVTELYCYVVPMVLGSDGSKEIVEYFFKLHFYNFEADLIECLMNVRKWTEKDRCEFLCDLQKSGPVFHKIPRGFNEYNQEMEKNVPKNGGEANQVANHFFYFFFKDTELSLTSPCLKSIMACFWVHENG